MLHVVQAEIEIVFLQGVSQSVSLSVSLSFSQFPLLMWGRVVGATV